jgi:hypothetical protein
MVKKALVWFMLKEIMDEENEQEKLPDPEEQPKGLNKFINTFKRGMTLKFKQEEDDNEDQPKGLGKFLWTVKSVFNLAAETESNKKADPVRLEMRQRRKNMGATLPWQPAGFPNFMATIKIYQKYGALLVRRSCVICVLIFFASPFSFFCFCPR